LVETMSFMFFLFVTIISHKFWVESMLYNGFQYQFL